MTEADAVEAVHEEFGSRWESAHPPEQSDPQHVPYTFRGETFSTSQLGALGAWVRLRMEETSCEQTTQGQTDVKFEHRGNIFVQAFAAVNFLSEADEVLDGEQTVLDLIEDIRNAISAKNVTTGPGDDEVINLYAGRSQPLPEKNGWFGRVLIVPYRFEETRSTI